MPRRSSGPVPHLALLALLLSRLIAAPAGAEPDAGEARPELTLGGEVRLRGYDLENMWDSDSDADRDHWSLLRLRTRVSVRAELEDGVRGYVRLANQNYGEGVTTANEWEEDNKSSKLFVDAAWLEVERAFGLPVTARLGRQSLMYGSGFVLFDGQSQLASTATYLDGIRLRVAPRERWRLDLLYFKDQENARDDASRDDVTLTGAYLTAEPLGAGESAELYWLRREDQALGKDVRMLGARVAHRLACGLDLDLEGALQGGDAVPGVDHEAWGVKAEAGFRLAGLPGAPRPFLGFAGLSGDDPRTADVRERWDVFYGGWPQFGDLLAWSFLNLGPGNNIAVYDPGYADGSSLPGEVVYGNLLLPTAGLALTPVEPLTVRLSWSPVTVHEAAGGPDDFGDYWQLGARYRYSAQLSLAVYAARIEPGAAFGPGADAQHELYWETELKF
jgi:hypothetical protein